MRQSVEEKRDNFSLAPDPVVDVSDIEPIEGTVAVVDELAAVAAIRDSRAGEAIASMQMRDRVANVVAQQAEQMDATFRGEDQAEMLRELESDIRTMAPTPAVLDADVEALVSDVARSIAAAMQATIGMPAAERHAELARAALFLPSPMANEPTA